MSSAGTSQGGRHERKGDLHLSRLRGLVGKDERVLFVPSLSRAHGARKDEPTVCTHCSVAGVPLDANFLYCEVLGCPAAYHEYCVDAAVAAAVAKQPALLD